ncbi:phosphatase PAP2 family protein [Agrobacterium vitis]|uniref:Phosphatase PAP2 family protein n=1 Tax=Agrobacterium vitis TaxID=373 RepID=A0A368NNP7_AGRVI|nr:phosphatase PAP2 family protein [Agrobacterium vitis]KAA3516718.1 phosphatase PAP2 family protein [Agrobacterium vitis]KAA3529483.1 phosphatase PAP2 family protein [Agrobacterium vitis]MCF1477534.1 phosphatase PAP2 family protein [Agrobacterium vitis]MUZ97259.1 phosphatase PAP2 family protein [Agrobacterium vitis]MVA28269.1 phosphatase PAP2 family protein [Agrobacterium vitis]
MTILARIKNGRRRVPDCRTRLCLLAGSSLVVLMALLFDSAIGNAGRLTCPVFYRIATVLTRIGQSDWCLLVSFLIAIEAAAASRLARTAEDRCRALFVSALSSYAFLSIAGSGIAANLLKRAFGRARPDQFSDAGAFDFLPFAGSARFESFPSGHATTIGALMMIAALIAPRHRPILAIAALWLGMTRVMVGAHYPSDVVAGLGFGAWFAWIVALGFARRGLVFRLSSDGNLVLRQKLIGDGGQRYDMPQRAQTSQQEPNPSLSAAAA